LDHRTSARHIEYQLRFLPVCRGYSIDVGAFRRDSCPIHLDSRHHPQRRNFSGASISISGGRVVATITNGGSLLHGPTTYMCASSGGRGIDDGRVTQGTVIAVSSNMLSGPIPSELLSLGGLVGERQRISAVTLAVGQLGRPAADVHDQIGAPGRVQLAHRAPPTRLRSSPGTRESCILMEA